MEPSAYVGHGAPTVAIEPELGKYRLDLRKFGKKFDPKTIVIVSAHWQTYLPILVASGQHPRIIYDFYGFPQKMYELQYNYKGCPEMATRIVSQLQKAGFDAALDPEQGIDHGAWVPLREMYPSADVPILQISLPVPRSSEFLFKVGESLRHLREEGVMFIGSGNLTHNLPYTMNRMRGGLKYNLPPDEWALEVDKWIKEHLDDGRYVDVLNAENRMPHFKLAAPTTEHFDPIHFILGTLSSKEQINHFHESFQMGAITMRSFHSEF